MRMYFVALLIWLQSDRRRKNWLKQERRQKAGVRKLRSIPIMDEKAACTCQSFFGLLRNVADPTAHICRAFSRLHAAKKHKLPEEENYKPQR